jgi:N-acetylmuramoyl-L-alanine amidase
VLRSVLINLSQSATIQASLTIGQNLLENIKSFANLHYQHMEQAAFVVLKSPDIPSLLVETGYLSNFVEEKRLNYPNYQLNLAQAMMRGIKEYFVARPPRGTWLASNITNKKGHSPLPLEGEG